jgi:hypothetical protein
MYFTANNSPGAWTTWYYLVFVFAGLMTLSMTNSIDANSWIQEVGTLTHLPNLLLLLLLCYVRLLVLLLLLHATVTGPTLRSHPTLNSCCFHAMLCSRARSEPCTRVVAVSCYVRMFLLLLRSIYTLRATFCFNDTFRTPNSAVVFSCFV